jgi:hypothetical protein
MPKPQVNHGGVSVGHQIGPVEHPRCRNAGGTVRRASPARAALIEVGDRTHGGGERRALGLLPPHEETPEEQAARAFEAYRDKPTDLERHIDLRALRDINETLSYPLPLDHLAEMIPLIDTPTVGLACEQFSQILRRPRGQFISYAERDDLDAILENTASPRVEVLVITDGERILGLGRHDIRARGKHVKNR